MIDITKQIIEIIPKKLKIKLPLSFRDDIGLGTDKPEEGATKSQIFAQNSAPTGDYTKGDIWFDTDNDNHPYRANSDGDWVSMRDGSIIAAAGTANWSEVTDDDGNKPENNADVTSDHQADISGSNINNDAGWTDDAAANAAQADATQAISDAAGAQGTADGKVTTFYQDSAPTAEGTGDLWIDTNDNNKLYRWSGAAWIEVRDAGIAQAISDAATAQSTADGKIVTFYQDSAPTAEGVGDIWVDTNDNNKPYRWSGSAWQAINNPTDWGDVLNGSATKPADNADVTADNTAAAIAGQGDLATKDEADANVLNMTNAPAEAGATAGATFGTNIDGGGSSNTQCGNDSYVELYRQDKFGDGTDGDVTISSNTTLTSDMYYNDLTINSGVTLTTDGYRVFVKGTLTNNGTIENNGSNGGDGSDTVYNSPGAGGAGGGGNFFIAGLSGGNGGNGGNYSVGYGGAVGVAGAAVTNSILADNGGAGGAGGSGLGSGGNAGGAGGTTTGATIKPRHLTDVSYMRDFSVATPAQLALGGGAGGGGGGGRPASGTSGPGAGGGGAGGFVVIFAKNLINSASGVISANGGNGGAGGNDNGTDAGGGGGGAGGHGGCIALIYETLTDSGSITASGGSGGAGGTGDLNNGVAGDNGSLGLILYINV